MGIEIQLSDPIRPNQTATFTFKYQVQAFAIGISAFNLTYGTLGHYIQQIKIKILPSQSGTHGNVVNAHIETQMHDGSGNTIDLKDSYVTAVCIAVTDTADNNTLLTNVVGIQNNASAGVTLPGTSGFSVLQSFLSGITLQYSSLGHEVLQANAGCGITYQQNNGSISASAGLSDSSGDQVNTALIDAGVAVSVDAGGPGFFAQVITTQASRVPVTFNSMKTISAAFALLQSWTVQYGNGDHWVKNISAGLLAETAVEGNTVILKDAYALISDASGNTQEDSASNVTLVVIAVP